MMGSIRIAPGGAASAGLYFWATGPARACRIARAKRAPAHKAGSAARGTVPPNLQEEP